MQQLGYLWTDFHENWYFNIFRKSVEKIQVSFKFDKNIGYFTWRHVHMILSCRILPIMRNVSDRSSREGQTYILCSVTVFRESCRSWDNLEKLGRAGHATDENKTHAVCMLDARGYIHTHQNMYYLLLFHGSKNFSNVPQCYTFIAWLVITMTECVYCAIRTEFFNIIEVNLYPWRVIHGHSSRDRGMSQCGITVVTVNLLGMVMFVTKPHLR